MLNKVPQELFEKSGCFGDSHSSANHFVDKVFALFFKAGHIGASVFKKNELLDLIVAELVAFQTEQPNNG